MSSLLGNGIPRPIVIAGADAETLAGQIPQTGRFVVESVVAQIDATGSGDVTPELTILDPSGVVIATKQQTKPVAGGTTGTATWALRLADDAPAAPAAGGDYVLISEQTPAGGVVTFAAIPATFRHLVMDLRLARTAAGVATVVIKWNNATAYDSVFVYFPPLAASIHRSADVGDGDGVYLNFGKVDGAGAQSRAYEIPATGSKVYADYVVQFPWYSRSDGVHNVMWQGSINQGNNKTYTTGSGGEELFNPPVPIDTIQVQAQTGQLSADSRATLYGVK